MSWLKDVIVDIAVTILIIAAVLLEDPWMKYLIWFYTGIMMATKGFILFGDSFLHLINKAGTDAPDWFAHLLYAVNTCMLFAFQWWYAASGWAVIWIFSTVTQYKLSSLKSQKTANK